MAHQSAIFAAGCFWCIESSFNRLAGVQKAVSGYCGGQQDDADYRSVCSGLTDHAEAVLVEFDDSIISYQTLLDIFFFLHDPTQLNRQGNDIGRQYRSAIFYLSEPQKKQAQLKIDELEKSGLYQQKIVTELAPAEPFYPAEDYHQGYFDNNQNQAYCQILIAPKMKKFSEQFSELLK